MTIRITLVLIRHWLDFSSEARCSAVTCASMAFVRAFSAAVSWFHVLHSFGVGELQPSIADRSS